MTSKEIRQQFLQFFASKGHHVVPSAPMVVKNDPTLMFTNAGMNQFKDIFLGNAPAPYQRATDSQKCLRVSGKHNDLEEVGHDTYHHTMFEMLGNWSFGDYFKKEAIAYAWEFLTEVLKINKENLYVTVFGGDAKDGLGKDEEAYAYWKEWVEESHILSGNKKDNFWEMGEQGPCGPCSEIHIDLRPEEEKKRIAGKEMVNKDHPLVIEIWNLVFMQYNRLADGTLEPLKAKHIDTGMGFERLCMVMQGKTSNYDTDVFQPLIGQLSAHTGIPYGKDEKADIAMRVCADHVRAIAFSIADGQLPSNIKAGYVIRRILRRAVRYGYTFLHCKEAFLHTLVPTLVAQMGEQFPELERQQTLITRIILEEEQAFLRTLSNGILKFEKHIAEKQGKTTVIDGAFAFELFDTYGFPIDLTRLMAHEQGWEVDMEGFSKGLEEQKQRSRAAAAQDTDDWVQVHPETEERFIGYDCLEAEVEVIRYRRIRTKEKTFYQLVFNQTPFYGESGGQAGDSGYLTSGEERIRIVTTKKENNLIVHITEALPAQTNGTFHAVVDEEKRLKTANNHTATHLLHQALRSVLGEHVEQKGSSVDAERLRFDFSHFAKMDKEDLRKVERMVNANIRRNLPLEEHRSLLIAEAKKMGAMALFGEKYGEAVRVVKYGDSIEFCGGTHASATGNIGAFRIVYETSVAAGIRRIEAVTGEAVESMLDSLQDQQEALKELLKSPKDLLAAVKKLETENSGLRTEVENARKAQAKEKAKAFETQLLQSPDHRLIARTAEDLNALRDALTELRHAIPDMALALASDFQEKPALLVVLGDEKVAKGLHAGNIIRSMAKEIQGGGGGQAAFATAGGKNAEGLGKAIEVAETLL